jgi:hypothetical protein
MLTRFYDLQIDGMHETLTSSLYRSAGGGGRKLHNTVTSPAFTKNGISVGTSQNTGDHIKELINRDRISH